MGSAADFRVDHLWQPLSLDYGAFFHLGVWDQGAHKSGLAHRDPKQELLAVWCPHYSSFLNEKNYRDSEAENY